MLVKFNRRKSGYWNQVEVKQDEAGELHFSDCLHIYDANNNRIAIIDKDPKSKHIRIQLLEGCYAQTGSDFKKFK